MRTWWCQCQRASSGPRRRITWMIDTCCFSMLHHRALAEGSEPRRKSFLCSLWKAFFMVSGAVFCTHIHTITHPTGKREKSERKLYRWANILQSQWPGTHASGGTSAENWQSHQMQRWALSTVWERGVRRSFCTYSVLPDINFRTRIASDCVSPISKSKCHQFVRTCMFDKLTSRYWLRDTMRMARQKWKF